MDVKPTFPGSQKMPQPDPTVIPEVQMEFEGKSTIVARVRPDAGFASKK